MRQQIFIDDEHTFDYELVDYNKHTLYYCDSEDWIISLRGEIALQLIDSGNGLKILTKFDAEDKMSYCESEMFFILLKIIHNPSKYEIAQKRLL